MGGRFMLLVEGNEDMHVFVHLFQQHNLPLTPLYANDDMQEGVTILSENGIESLLDDISVRLKGGGSGGLERLGIVVDADLDIAKRWEELRRRLVGVGYAEANVPIDPNPDGTIIAQIDKPMVGIWVMPDNRLPGILEDFIGFLIDEKDPLWLKAIECVGQLPNQLRPFGQHTKKAEIHTWLAWQEEPGTPMGQALTKRYLDPFAPHAQQLIAWLRRLFASQAAE